MIAAENKKEEILKAFQFRHACHVFDSIQEIYHFYE